MALGEKMSNPRQTVSSEVTDPAMGVGLVPRIALSFLFCILVASNTAFFRFEDLVGNSVLTLLIICAGLGSVLFVWSSTASMGESNSPGIRVTTVCFVLALVLCLLGGEGRLFYANLDWQVRDPLYHDLATHSWPFKYLVSDHFLVLRAPLGMYMLPALVTKLLGHRTEGAALLLQNSLMLGCLLCIVASFFPRKRQWLALVVFIFFGGMEIIGYTARTTITHAAWRPDHIEWWATYYQYSSFITDIFWTPHHALPGFMAGLLYALWSRNLIRRSLFLSAVPLLGFWSPFAFIGIVPFALYACITGWGKGVRVTRSFLVLALIAAACLPSVLYLHDAPNGVVWSFGYLPLSAPLCPPVVSLFLFMLFFVLQAVPFLVIVLLERRNSIGFIPLSILATILLFAPLIHVGQGIDFCTRATIPALTVLAIEVIESLYVLQAEMASWSGKLILSALSMILCLGSLTGMLEVRRALSQRPVKATGCNFVDGWTASAFNSISYATYLAPEKAMPVLYQHKQAEVVKTGFSGPCWIGNWYVPR